MGVEIELWRAIGHTVIRVPPSTIALEKYLEDYIEDLPSMLGRSLLVVRRQVGKKSGGRIDILAIDEDGVLHVIEVKRGHATPDVLAQIFSYGLWVKKLSRAEIVKLFARYRRSPVSLEQAFLETFHRPLPSTINVSQVYTIVAASLDRRVEQSVQLLSELGVPINAALFQYFPDRGADYLARAWLVDPGGATLPSTTGPRQGEPIERVNDESAATSVKSPPCSSAANPTHESLRSCLDEPHPHLGKMCTWSTTDAALGFASVVTVHRRHDANLSNVEEQIRFFWHAFVTRFAWDLLPADFLYALWSYWLSTGETTHLSQVALTQSRFAKMLTVVATASGEWIYTRSRPGSLMNAVEPLTDLVPHWKRDESGTAIRGLRRVGTVRKSGPAKPITDDLSSPQRH